VATGFKISSAPDSIVRITIRRTNTIGNLLWKTNLAKSFVIFDEAVEINPNLSLETGTNSKLPMVNIKRCHKNQRCHG